MVTQSIEGGLKHAKYPKLFPWSISNTSQLLVSVVRRVFPSIATSSITSLSSILSLVHSLMIITQITMSFCRQGPGRNAAKEKTESFLSKVIFEVSKIASFESKIEEPFRNRRTILYDLYHIPKTRTRLRNIYGWGKTYKTELKTRKTKAGRASRRSKVVVAQLP